MGWERDLYDKISSDQEIDSIPVAARTGVLTGKIACKLFLSSVEIARHIPIADKLAVGFKVGFFKQWNESQKSERSEDKRLETKPERSEGIEHQPA